jgi:adenosyl cobinamide kinase/adenosyl cobinamide phosphate guanylyltransferase
MITLVLGGMRSGKSEVAERLAAACPPPVLYVATGEADPEDVDFTRRVAVHRARRPRTWTTVEEPHDVAGALLRFDATALVDGLGTWVANAHGFAADVGNLCEALVRRHGDTILVSDEVGLSVHPPTDAGRRFADALGACNQAVAKIADRVLLVVAGRVLELGRA